MQKKCFAAAITVSIIITIILSPSLSVLANDHMQLAFANHPTMIKNQFKDSITTNSSGNSTSPKVVILNFYDDDKSQFTNAKSILDKYGFKGTFFIVCNWANLDSKSRMTWQDISQLSREHK